MEQEAKIYVAGHTGLVGSAIVRELGRQGYKNLCLISHYELDLRDQRATEDFFREEKPEYVFMAAATVGGVLINDTLTGQFLYDNLAMSMNVIHAAYKFGVKKLLYMGSGCVYPRMAEQPVKEEALLTGEFEKTNEAYAVAKLSGLKMCEYYNKQYGTDFISCMPCNAYGPGDNFDLESSHVVPALIRKAHKAKMEHAAFVTVWGTGRPIREFIYIDDIASACVFLMRHYSGDSCINIGTGKEFTIQELTEIVCREVGFHGEVKNDLEKPDGAPRRILDSSKLFAMGWRPSVRFAEGIRRTYQDFLEQEGKYTGKRNG